MDERPWDPPRYGAEHPVDVRFAPTEAERRHKSGMIILRYANTGEDCGSATHGTIRRHHSWGLLTPTSPYQKQKKDMESILETISFFLCQADIRNPLCYLVKSIKPESLLLRPAVLCSLPESDSPRFSGSCPPVLVHGLHIWTAPCSSAALPVSC